MKKKFPHLDFPERLTVEITNTCNLACAMCPKHNTKSDTGFMSLDLYKKIIDEARHFLPITLVPFFRGESLLHPEFFEMIRIAKKSSIGPIQLATNATLLNNEVSIKLIESGIDFISFSLDVDKSNYESSHLGGSFEKVTDNIYNFITIKKKRSTNNPEIQVSTVETTKNIHSVHEFCKYWIKKVDRVRIYSEHSTNGTYGSLDNSSKNPVFSQRFPCKKVFTDMVIYWDGVVAVCNHDWNRKEFIGNISNDSIQDIWTGSKYDEIRNRHLDGKLEKDQTCKDCDHWKMYYLKEGNMGTLYKK